MREREMMGGGWGVEARARHMRPMHGVVYFISDPIKCPLIHVFA